MGEQKRMDLTPVSVLLVSLVSFSHPDTRIPYFWQQFKVILAGRLSLIEAFEDCGNHAAFRESTLLPASANPA
jgi:hypothetical protein